MSRKQTPPPVHAGKTGKTRNSEKPEKPEKPEKNQKTIKPEKPKTQLRGVLMLLLTALIWGLSFVAQSVGMESVECFTYTGIRTLMGAAVLIPFIVIPGRRAARTMTAEQNRERKKRNRRTVLAGIPLGLVFCAAQNLQQYAFNDSTAGKIAFITALYMFFVPLLGLLLGKRVAKPIWLCIAAGFVGLYFLTMSPGSAGGINRGDFFAFLCSIFFAVQILMIERMADRTDGVLLSCTQFVVSGVISCVLMFVLEHPTLHAVRSALLPLLYSGVLSCGVAYTLQIIGQKYTEATLASMLMCLESVFAVLGAAVLLHELLTVREIIGCVILFAAIIASQLIEALEAKHAQSSAAEQ